MLKSLASCASARTAFLSRSRALVCVSSTIPAWRSANRTRASSASILELDLFTMSPLMPFFNSFARGGAGEARDTAADLFGNKVLFLAQDPGRESALASQHDCTRDYG